MKASTALKWGLFVFAGYYAWRSAKQNGGSLFGNTEGVKVKIDPGLAVDMITEPFGVSPVIRQSLKVGAHSLVKTLGQRYGIEKAKLG